MFVVEDIFKDKLLSEALSIGDEVIAGAHKDAMGWHWRMKGAPEHHDSELTLYNGVPGIIIFLIDLFKASGKQKYLEAIIQGCKWLDSRDWQKANLNLSFFTGLGGLMYLYIQMFKLTDEHQYLHKAEDIARYDKFAVLENKSSDLLNGIAGEIIALLHLYELKQERWLFEKIEARTYSLLSKAMVTPTGIYWGIFHSKIKPLCGFSHGASGYGFVFLQLYKYFNNPAFLAIAESTLRYEDSHFDIKANNWPDFRQNTSTIEQINGLENAYRRGTFDELVKPRFLSFWCHGAPGIGMVRLYEYETTQSNESLGYFERALDNIRSNISRSTNYTLCHGLFGSGHLLLNGFVSRRNISFYKDALVLGLKAISFRKQYGFYRNGYNADITANYCLFMGTSGIGDYYLRLLNPTLPTVIFPIINSQNTIETNHFSTEVLTSIMLRRVWVNTYEKTPHAVSVENFPFNGNNLSKAIISYFDDTSSSTSDARVINNVDLDKTRATVLSNMMNFTLYFIERYSNFKAYKEITSLQNKHARMNPYAALKKYVYAAENKYFLIQPVWYGDGIEQIELTAMQFLLLNAFKEDGDINDKIRQTRSQAIVAIPGQNFTVDSLFDIVAEFVSKGCIWLMEY